ncbi:MAG TPA: hypothetical protein VFU63_13660, partial [Ktedonobacterales bacterium]|nr:hypothetical protein [Ktedonobacterales bacterium]
MQTLLSLLRSRVGIAICGVIFLGSLGAYIGAASVPHPGAALTNNGSIANAGSAANTTNASGPGGTNGTSGGNPSATDTPGNGSANVPTRTTTTNIPVGQTVDLHGTIGTINTAANSFILNVNGSPTTIVANSQTSFQGAASSLQGLEMGWKAEVKGQ